MNTRLAKKSVKKMPKIKTHPNRFTPKRRYNRKYKSYMELPEVFKLYKKNKTIDCCVYNN